MRFKYSEEDRLDALHNLKLLDTKENENFDRITRLASQYFHAPISLISLVAKDRQWFKSRFGMDTHEIPIEDSFCRYTIQSNEGLIINDATKDKRFSDNKLVVSANGLRFYAGVPLITSDGFAVGTICVADTKPRHFSKKDKNMLQDFSDIAMSEIDSVVYAQKAEESSKMKSEFLATISHEIRTPMNGVIAMSKRLLETALNDRQQHYTNTISHSADDLLNIINDILDFSRIEAGKIEFETIPFNIHQVCIQSINLLEEKAQEKNLNLSLKYSDRTLSNVVGDPVRLKQIIINLTGNAIKFTDKGSVTINITTEKILKNQINLKISICDTGIGISISKMKNLFERFSQADSSMSRRYGGTGLGLAITKQLVELIGGRITVSSIEGKGSTFTFSIPLMLQNCGNLPSTRKSNKYKTIPVFKGVNILLAEDNRINQEVMISLMENYTIPLEVFPNGKAALEARRDKNFNLILMDCQMPGMDGYEATHLIREYERQNNLPEIPIIALTANAMKGDRENCLKAGMNDYLSKPIIESELESALRRWLPALKRTEVLRKV